MEQFFGKMVIGATENTGAQNGTPPIAKTQFVHYPDCQQLIIWLPQSGYDYGAMRLVDTRTQQVVDERPTSDRLSGSIQLLWDTLDIAPGEYDIEIDHPEGWKHRIAILKYPEHVEPPVEKPVEKPAPETAGQPEPIVYRDGLGNEIPNEDLLLREKLQKEIATKFSRRIEYEGTFRAGMIIYVDNEKRIGFSHEMGGGHCMFYIDIPTEAQWEAQTKTPLSQRQEILEFVAATVQAQQASNCRYEIGEKEIGFYYRDKRPF